jgi:hypothetical protein
MVQVGHPSGGMLILGKDNTDYSYFTHEASTQTSNWFYRGGAGITLNSAGLVGIGNSAPSKLLTIGTASTVNTTVRLNSSIADGSDTATYSFGVDDTGDYAGIRLDHSDRTTKGLQIFTYPGYGYPISFSGSTGQQDLTIDAFGRVGIGTTSPGSELHVAASSGFAELRLAGASGSGAALEFYNSTTNLGDIFIDASNNMIFRNASEAFRVDSSRRLLVGTSTQQGDHYLQVQGSATASSYPGSIFLRRGLANASIGDGNQLGVIDFGNQDGGKGATISAEGDAAWGTNDYPGRLVFSTTADGASSPTERMRITNGGDFYFNCTVTTKTTEGFRVENSGQPTVSRGTNGTFIQFFHAGDGSQIGSITNNGGTATAYNTSSDYRLKENVTAVTDGITRLQQLKPSRFNFIADPDKTVDGFLAHEVQTIVPEAITGEKDAVDEDGNPEYQGIDQSKLVPLLTAALQEAIGRIETLEGMVAVNNITIDEQQHQLSALAARLTALESA